MSGIDNVLNKIERDAEEKAEAIIKAAEESAALKKQEIESAANAEADKILQNAKSAAARAKDQIITASQLEVRNMKLAAKQESIAKVFEAALEVLNNIPADDFLKFAAGYCKGANIKPGDMILVPEKMRSIDAAKINANLTMYTGERTVDGGFVLISGGIEQNNTFSALIDFYRSDLEPLVIQKLF